MKKALSTTYLAVNVFCLLRKLVYMFIVLEEAELNSVTKRDDEQCL